MGSFRDIGRRPFQRATAISPRPEAVTHLPAGLAWRLKAIVEWLVAAALFVALLPFLGFTAFAVMLDSAGGPLFVQPRFGRHGVPFGAMKFRTMVASRADLSGGVQTQDRDPRITRVGWLLRVTSLDELPQIANVLAGQMALIGPRAHPCGMRVEGELCADLLPDYHLRHAVRPGITGWAQVNGSRGAVKTRQALQERLELDLDYIAHWSPLLDLKILLRTIGVVLSRAGAN